jgi:hypothetical protein
MQKGKKFLKNCKKTIQSFKNLDLMKLTFTIAIFLFISSHALAAAPNFELETSRLTKAIGCKNPKIQPGYTIPKAPLYICMVSDRDYLETFVNDDGSGNVKNIKLVWDDRTKARPPATPPVHARKTEAKAMLDAILKLYAPDARPLILNAFFNLKKSASFDSAKFRIEFTYSKGPAIDERQLILNPKHVGGELVL